MLTKKERLTITGESVINGETVCNFVAVFSDFENPEEVGVAQTIKDKALYKENRKECRNDFAEFEDYVYEFQAKLLNKN